MYLTISITVALLLVLFRKNLLNYIFLNFHPLFNKHRNLGKIFGIQYKSTINWSTDRQHTRLFVSSNPILKRILGFSIEAGDLEKIKELKKRQRVNQDRPIDLVQYFQKGEKYSFDKLEKKLIETWLFELTAVYQIPYPEDGEKIITGLQLLRNIMGKGSRISFIWSALMNIHKLLPLGKYWKSLDYSEKLIVFVPFLTTIDTCMINFVTGSKPEKMKDLFKNTPVKYVPMISDGQLVICDVIPNEESNPGNSVFGPKGVICPGNIVTSAMVKAMMDLMNHFDYKVEGTPQFGGKSIINRITNPDEINITL